MIPQIEQLIEERWAITLRRRMIKWVEKCHKNCN